ncbi:ubiquitin-conjugating enzyme [Sodiomyces alkalinus F11]|uniref:Ubiquitin-conjugating enzyme E2 2 n=1 Tax=Sodiomyces alkalinus (strain CBS 110278 / VKM F-3762 / F11) TaxID=1314773 RepID=A0A3N2QAA1_SODAK|nr:ubiquitin-conjugating enzyme [Sodiomyces alkalinus F11]ROT43679.1 ubiquitin-conjugating enzyme [Sodiomyces alkalinus F11]
MSSPRERRILKELADIEADRDKSGVYAQPVSEQNVLHLKGTITGPPDTPYAGGRYIVDIVIPGNYPFKSPIMKFETKVWHPNVSSQTGAICLDTLGTGWSPVQTVKTALLSLRMLLEFPNPKDPQDAEVAKMMMSRPEDFAQKAHEWAVVHASAPPNPSLDKSRYRRDCSPEKAAIDESRYQGYNRDLVERFASMGFEVETVVDAFNYVGIDRNNGQDYELEEAYIGDITARLFNEH